MEITIGMPYRGTGTISVGETSYDVLPSLLGVAEDADNSVLYHRLWEEMRANTNPVVDGRPIGSVKVVAQVRLPEDLLPLWNEKPGPGDKWRKGWRRSAWMSAALTQVQADLLAGFHQAKTRKIDVYDIETFSAGEGAYVHRALARSVAGTKPWLQRKVIAGAKAGKPRYAVTTPQLWELRKGGESFLLFSADDPFDAVEKVRNGTAVPAPLELLAADLYRGAAKKGAMSKEEAEEARKKRVLNKD